MNRDIKIKYVLQHGETGRICSKVFTLEEIERGEFQQWFDKLSDTYYLIAKLQYTGLNDENGNGDDIYEKDIMEFYAYGMHYIGIVEYHGSAFGIICKNTKVKASPFLDDAIDRHGAIKIGNIHENPEMMEGME